MRISRNCDSQRPCHATSHCEQAVWKLIASSAHSSRNPIFSLTELGGIIGLTRKPAAELVVSFQITDLPLICHRVLQHAHEAHGYSRAWLILGFVELSREVL